VFSSPTKGFPHALFIVSIIIVFYKMYTLREEKYFLVLLFLILSWATSISWGYHMPILFSAPMIFILSISIHRNFNQKNIELASFSLLIFALITFYVGYQNPYNLDHPLKKSNLTYKMDEIYPKLKYIYGDKETYMEYKELKSLISQYNQPFAVLPSATLIHYLSDTKNFIGVDWVMNAEINDQDSKIISILESKDIIVFLEKGALNPDGKFGSRVSVYISENWNKIKEGQHFDVYIQKNI
jgi:hypothetical protein